MADGVRLAEERFLSGHGRADGAGRGRIAYAVGLVAHSRLGAAGTLVGTSALLEAVLVPEHVHLGSTLYGRRWWGTEVNPEAELLLMTHCFGDCGFGRILRPEWPTVKAALRARLQG